MAAKEKKYKDVRFTVGDALRFSPTFKAACSLDVNFASGCLGEMDKSFTHNAVASLKFRALLRLKEMEEAGEIYLAHEYGTLPSEILASLPTVDNILIDPSILNLVSSGKVSWMGLIRLSEKGDL